MDQNSRRHMSREKSDRILKMVVKNFFLEKEVTSTLVMDSLYSGLKALVGQTKGQTGKGKYLDAEEQTVPIVSMENDMFVLVDDILILLERAVLEPLPAKDEKGPQNRTKVSCIIAFLKLYASTSNNYSLYKKGLTTIVLIVPLTAKFLLPLPFISGWHFWRGRKQRSHST